MEQGVATVEDIDKGLRLASGRKMGIFEIGDMVGLPTNIVLKMDFASGKLDVIEREAKRRLFSRFVCRRGRFRTLGLGDKIRKIPTMVLVQHKGPIKTVQTQFFNHRSPFEKRDGL